ARLLLLEILARPEMASVAELAINRPEMREIATGVLVNGSTAPTEGLSRSAVEAPLLLRILATSGTGETARQMLQAVGPEPLSRLIQDSRNQAFLFDLIVKAESPEIALELLSSGPAREALRRVGTLAGSEGRLTALLESPATAPALLDVLSETLSSQDLARLFTDKAFQSRLPALLGDPDSARALLQIAGKPEMQGMARFILARRDTPDRLAQWLASEQTFEASLQVLQNATPDLRVRLAAALHDAAMQPETLRALEALFTQEADPEVRSAALKLLSWPELTEAAARVLESPEARETLVRMLTQAADAIRRLAPEIPASETGKLPDLENLLRLLSRPEMASTLRRVFAFQEIRTALGDLLAPPESIPAEDRSVRDAASILRLLSRSELTNAATEILSRADVRSRIPFFLLQPDVRGAMLEVLSAPGLEHVARAALATPEAQSTLLIALQDPKTQAHLPRLLDSSLAEPILRLVADNGGRLDISGALQKPEVQQRLFALLKNPALRSITLEILTRPDLVRNTATFVGDHPETLLSLLNSPETCRLLATLFQKPQMTKALERFLRVARRSDQLPDSARSFLRELEGLPHGAASQGREGTATGIGAGIRRLFGFGSTHAPVPSSAVLPDTTASPVPSRVTPSNSTRTVAQATPPSPESAITGSIREVLHEASTARTTGDAPLPLRTEAIHYAFNYHLAVLFPWFGFGGPVSAASVSAAVHAEDGAYIPTFLDLIQDEPLMLPWEPGELMIPGTDIPLILPREDRP
ncbi:hypothetical protein HQ520_11895, partial [bacterium]|nr:hypothetical protein [bacterium]